MDQLFMWIGIITSVVSLVVVLYSASAILGKLAWYASWKWGTAKQRVRSVRLGWNAGEPPENEWILVREHTEFNSVRGTKSAIKRDWDWAVMRRRGDWLHSVTGGFSMPIQNCTGWLYITEDTPSESELNPDSK